MADKETLMKEAKAEVRAEARAAARAEDNRALARLNRSLKTQLNKANEEPHVMQLAIAGGTAIAGTAAGVATHRALRKKTETWIQKDEKGVVIKDDAGQPKRTLGAVLVSEILPIAGGVGLGILSCFSKSGIVAAGGGGLSWGFAGGVMVDVLMPAKAPAPKK